MTVLRTAYVEVMPRTDRFEPELARRLRRIDTSVVAQRLGSQFSAGLAKGMDRSGTFANAMAGIAAGATLMGAAVGAAAPAVVQLTAALAPAAGAAAALPAALLAVTAASGAVKLAVKGVGEAIQSGFGDDPKKAAKELAKLPPEARKFATAVVGMKSSLDGLQASTAARFFGEFNDQVAPLSRAYLPALNSDVPRLAGALGGVAREAASAAREGQAVGAVRAVLGATTGAATSLQRAVRPVVLAFADLVRDGSPVVAGLGESIADTGLRFAGFIRRASEAGRITAWIDGAKQTFRDLGGVVGNVGGILRSVYQSATTNGANLLANLRDLTGQAREFLTSADGQTGLTSAFSTLAALGQALKTALGGAMPQVAAAIAAAAPAMTGLAGAAAQLVIAVAPLLPYLTGIAATILSSLTPAAAGLAGWMSRNATVAKALATTVVAVTVGLKLYAAYTRAAATATGLHAVATTAANSTLGLRIRLAALDAAAWVRSTAATVASTTATAANRAATAVASAATAAFTAVKNFELLAWVRTTAATVASTAAALAHAVASKAVRAAILAWTGVQWALNAALSANPIGLVVAAVAALIAIVVVAYRKNETFRNVVNAAWAGIKAAISAVVTWWTVTAWPAIKRGIDFLVTAFQRWMALNRQVWAGVQAAIGGAWSWIRDRVFTPMRVFITQTIPAAFRAGTSAIRAAWDKVREYARKPVEFVVNQVINRGLVGSFNRIAGKIPGAPKLPTVAFAAGGHYHGRLPGAPSAVDNTLGMGPGGQPVALAGGEYIVNARQTARHLPLLEAVNRGAVPGYAGGGLLDFLAGPAKWLRGKTSAVIEQAAARFGQSPFARMAVGAGRLLINTLARKAAGLIGFGGEGGGPIGAWPAGPGAARGDSGVWRSIIAMVRSAGIPARATSTYRHGDPLWHGSGRAVDFGGYNQDRLAQFFMRQRNRVLELIHTTNTGGYYITRGRRVASMGVQDELHRNHLHIAMADGGVIGEPVIGRGLRSGRSYSFGERGPETVTPGVHGPGGVHFHFHGPVASRRAAQDMVLEAWIALKRERRIA